MNATPGPTDVQVEAFKAAWLKADANGHIGERTRAGLRAALAAKDDATPEPTAPDDVPACECGRGLGYIHAVDCPLRLWREAATPDRVLDDRPWLQGDREQLGVVASAAVTAFASTLHIRGAGLLTNEAQQ